MHMTGLFSIPIDFLRFTYENTAKNKYSAIIDLLFNFNVSPIVTKNQGLY